MHKLKSQNGIQIYTLAPVAGWNCNTRSYTDCTKMVHGVRYTVRYTGVTVPTSDWCDVYICFISVIDNSIYFKDLNKGFKTKKDSTFTIELWLLLTRRVKMGKDNNHVRTARAVYCDHCDVVIVTLWLWRQGLLHTWCHRLKCPTIARIVRGVTWSWRALVPITRE